MKTNRYYRTVLQRSNSFVQWFTGLFDAFASSCLLLLEVFIRKDFGKRYFNFQSVIQLAFLLAVIPVLILKVPEWLGMMGLGSSPSLSTFDGTIPAPVSRKLSSLFPRYLCWYVFIAGFLAIGLWHQIAMMFGKPANDTYKFSLYSGTFHPLFERIKIPGILVNGRLVECLLEPLFFFVIGVFFWMIGQTLGYLLMFASFTYAMHYVGSYRKGDHFVMDILDGMISNAEMENAFVKGLDGSQTNGFQFRGTLPADEELRRTMLPLILEEEEAVSAAPEVIEPATVTQL